MAKKKVAKKSVVKKPAKKAAAPKKVIAVPTDVPQLTPYLTVNDGAAAIEFYKQVFGAKVKTQMFGPDGKTLAHAALRIGNSILMLGEPMGGSNAVPAGKSSGVMLYVKDTHAVFQKAISLGAKQLMPVADQFWGDRWGMFEDPFGNVWQIATHIEDVKPAEMAKRAAEAFGGPPPAVTDAGTPPPPPTDITSEHVAQA
jgi:PhnB protein